MKLWNHPNGCNLTVKQKRERRRPSLSRILILCQASLLLLILLFTIVSTVFLNRATLTQFRQEQQQIIQDSIAVVRSDLESTEQVLWSLFADISERQNLYSEDSGEQYFGKYSTYQDICNVCALNPDIGFVFAAKKNDFMVSYASASSYNNLEIREHLGQMLDEDFKDLSLFQWNLIYIKDTPYFIYTYYYFSRNLYVGNVVPAAQEIETLTSAIGSDSTFTITDISGREWRYDPGEPQNGQGMGYAYECSLTESISVSGFTPHILGNQMAFSTLQATVGLGIVCVLGLLLQSFVVYQTYAKPITSLSRELTDVEGDLHHITISEDAYTKELYSLKGSIRHLLNEVITRRLDAYESKLREQDTQLFMLRSQLRPHFYLNAITTINSMTYQGREEDIRHFLDALSVHMRYMMRTDESRITLGEEIKHIRAYIAMQEIRYPSKIIHHIDIPEEMDDIMIPHLILYTVVENTFKYSMGIEDVLLIMIQGEWTGDGFKVTVEDNGNGYPQDVLQLYNGPLPQNMDSERKRHIGLRNIKQTLELKYKRSDLLRIRNSVPHGAVTELTFPVKKK